MSCVEPIETAVVPVAETKREALQLPKGLLGFEELRDYVLISNPDEEPFSWLQVEGNASLAFVVMDPFLALADYQPDIPQGDVEFLKLKRPEDATLFCIVTIAENKPPTVNLKGPIVVNRHTHTAKQVIIANAAAYSVQHPLPVAAE
jgi:flagellar assembly factor FliW